MVSLAAVFRMSHNASAKVLLGERCVTSKKRLRGRPSIYSTTEYISVLKMFCEILFYGTVDIGLLVSLLVVKLL